jgi:hypothetical protein
MERKSGYYRVKFLDKWIIAQWFPDAPNPHWLTTENRHHLYWDSDFEEINETPINPDPQTIAPCL